MSEFSGYEKMPTSLKKLGLDASDFSKMEKLKWVITEKIHGANFSFIYENGTLKYAKRKEYLSWTDDFFGFQLVVNKIENDIIRLFEDLSGKVPTLLEWFDGQETLAQTKLIVPEVSNKEVYAFLHKPFLQTNLTSTYLITASDFGVYLMHNFFDPFIAMDIRSQIPTEQNVQTILSSFLCKYRLQYSLDMKVLDLIKDEI